MCMHVWASDGALRAWKSVEYRKSMVMLVVIEGVTDAKLHINLYIDKRFTQKVKIVTYFVKQAYRKNIVTLQQEI